MSKNVSCPLQTFAIKRQKGLFLTYLEEGISLTKNIDKRYSENRVFENEKDFARNSSMVKEIFNSLVINML